MLIVNAIFHMENTQSGRRNTEGERERTRAKELGLPFIVLLKGDSLHALHWHRCKMKNKPITIAM